MDYQSALLDQGWFRDYNGLDDWQRLLNFLHKLGDPSIDRDTRRVKQQHLFNAASKGAPNQSGFYLLERAFEFENLFVDKEALRLRGNEIPNEFRNFIVPLSPDLDTYNRAAATVQKEISRTPQAQRNELNELGLWPKTEYFDRLFTSQENVPTSIAQSEPHHDWTRAFFYLAFAEAIGVTPLLSGTKARFVTELGACMLKSQHDQVQKIFDDAFLEQWRTISEPGSNVWDLWSKNVPPILEHITNRAIKLDTSAYNVFMDLRDSPSARDYRNLLWKLRECVSNGRAGLIEANKVYRDLHKVAKAWSSTLDVGSEVKHVHRTLRLRCIPIIGRLLELFNMDEAMIKDKILDTPPGFLVFCSSWYSDPFD